MVNHPDSVTYDAFDCNSGNPHEPNTHWDPKTRAWEWDDLKLNPGSVPDSFPQEVKEALENNICIICGKKNCPYIKNNKDYQKLTDALKKGDAGEARKIYMTKFAQRRGQSKGVVMEGLQKSREAKKRDGRCGGSKPFQSKGVNLIPGIWSGWMDLAAVSGNDAYTASFDHTSNSQSSFDVQIQYPTANGIETINTIGPGSQFIKTSGIGTPRIRFKTHSVPISVRVDYPQN